MAKKLVFADNVATINGRAKSFKRMFDEIDYSTEIYYFTKKTFKHEEEGFEFEYKYVVRVEDLYELTGEDDYKGKVEIDLYLVPTEKSLCEKTRARVRESCGLADDDRLLLSDIVSYGLGARILYEIVDNCRYIDGSKVKSKLLAIANMVDMIDGIRGFYLDAVWNGIGTTGWDVLKEMIHGKDYIESSFERLRA